MTDLELERVRRLLAEASAASARRAADFNAAYADLVIEISDYWKSLAPEGASLPAELIGKVDDFKRKYFD
jgi:hypothetical protein